MPRSQSHHLHLPHLTFDSSRQMRLIYFMRVLRDLVNKVAYFFFPIYLFNSGQAILLPYAGDAISQVQAGMVFIAGYYLVYKLAILITAIPLGQLATKIGYQKTLVWSYLINASYFLVLFLSLSHPWLIVLAAIINGVQVNMFWPIYKTILTRSAHKRKMGSDLGLLQFLLQLVAVIAPAIAGIISLKLGFEVLFLVGLIGTLSGLIVVMMMDIKTDKTSPNWEEFLNWLKERRYRKLILSMAGRYISDTVIYLWPLYVFFLLKEVSKVGFLYTISLFLAMTITMFTTFIIDKIKTRKVFNVSAGIYSLVWLARTQAFSIVNIAVIDTINQLISNFHWLYYDMILFRRGKGRKAQPYFVYYEIVTAGVGILFWLTFITIFLFFNQWRGLFVLGAAGVLMSLLIQDK